MEPFWGAEEEGKKVSFCIVSVLRYFPSHPFRGGIFHRSPFGRYGVGKGEEEKRTIFAGRPRKIERFFTHSPMSYDQNASCNSSTCIADGKKVRISNFGNPFSGTDEMHFHLTWRFLYAFFPPSSTFSANISFFSAR